MQKQVINQTSVPFLPSDILEGITYVKPRDPNDLSWYTVTAYSLGLAGLINMMINIFLFN